MESTEKKPTRGKRGQGCVFEQAGSRNLWVKFSIDGRVYRLSAETEKKNEALDFLRDSIAKYRSGEALEVRKVTVDDLYALLLADYGLKGQSIYTVELNWKNHLKPEFSGMQAKNIGSSALARYVKKRQAEKASPASINRELSLLQRAFTLGYEHEPRKVAHPLRYHRLAESKARQGFIEETMYRALAANCPDLFMRSMLALAFSFGFRKSELLTLKTGDVDLMNGTLRLRDSKNGDARKVALAQETRSLLAECMRGKSAEDAVFTRGKGTKAVADFRGTWRKITVAANCPSLLFHDLRRSAVRGMVRAGIPENVAMKISGHRTRAVFDRYDICSERDLVEAAKKIESSTLGHSLVIAEESDEKTESPKPVRM